MLTGNVSIIPIPALDDNYIWAISDGQCAAVVDPGEAAPVLEFLGIHQLELAAILCTHRHRDHIGGIPELREVYNVPVYGRKHPGNPSITQDLREGQQLQLGQPGIGFRIMELPGHLEDHIAYVNDKQLFCGDILFGGGCGKNFEGTPEQLFHSLQRLAALPDDTAMYCAHEYTLYCLSFALACEPANQALQARLNSAREQRKNRLPTLPSSIGLERQTNPFLRCDSAEIIQTLYPRHTIPPSALEVFQALQQKLGDFRLRENVF